MTCCVTVKRCAPDGSSVYSIGEYLNGVFQSTSHAVVQNGSFTPYLGDPLLLTECGEATLRHSITIPEEEIVMESAAAASANTVKVQSYIDQGLNEGMKEVHLPKGHFYIEQLRTYIPGAGASTEGFGTIDIIGCGRPRHGVIEGALNDYSMGTVMESVITDGRAMLQVSGVDGSQPTQHTVLECFMCVYKGTGYAIDANYNPYMKMKEIGVRVDSTTGGAFLFGDSWWAYFDDIIFAINRNVVSSATLVKHKPTIFHGLTFTFNDFHFQNGGVQFDSSGATARATGGQFIRGAFQNPSIAGFWNRADGGLYTVSFDACHFEQGSPDSFIRMDSGRMLEVTGITEMLASHGPTGAPTTALMNINNIYTVRVDSLSVFRPTVPVLKVTPRALVGTKVNVENTLVIQDQLTNTFNAFTGGDMWIENTTLDGQGSATITLLDPAFTYHTVNNDVVV